MDDGRGSRVHVFIEATAIFLTASSERGWNSDSVTRSSLLDEPWGACSVTAGESVSPASFDLIATILWMKYSPISFARTEASVWGGRDLSACRFSRLLLARNSFDWSELFLLIRTLVNLLYLGIRDNHWNYVNFETLETHCNQFLTVSRASGNIKLSSWIVTLGLTLDKASGCFVLFCSINPKLQCLYLFEKVTCGKLLPRYDVSSYI